MINNININKKPLTPKRMPPTNDLMLLLINNSYIYMYLAHY